MPSNLSPLEGGQRSNDKTNRERTEATSVMRHTEYSAIKVGGTSLIKGDLNSPPDPTLPTELSQRHNSKYGPAFGQSDQETTGVPPGATAIYSKQGSTPNLND